MNSCLASRISEAKPAIQRANLKCPCKDGNIYFASWKFRVALFDLLSTYRIQKCGNVIRAPADIRRWNLARSRREPSRTPQTPVHNTAGE